MNWFKVRAPSGDIVLALVLVVVIGALILPLPPWLLDAALALNLAFGVSLLLAALFARAALDLSAFPMLILFSTLSRLALNVSTTRLALSSGEAGQVIEAFGEVVIAGNYVVGAVLFAILTVVQLLVVTKGAERVAEVSARFTLDAMPGKQMSIDADLRSGAIDAPQARARRDALEQESQMFGAMDGAMKFIKGDAIAGLLIVATNLIGGTAIGVFQQGLTFSAAASNYALLAIGDGLVSQIPSLCTALAAGLVVTRVGGGAEDFSLAKRIQLQLFGNWKVPAVLCALCAALGSIPGMPWLTFLLLSAGSAWLAWRLRSATTKVPPVEPVVETADVAPAAGVIPVSIELAEDLSQLLAADASAMAELLRVRQQLFIELGVSVPPIQVRTGARGLAAGEYVLLIDEVPCARAKLSVGSCYALAPPTELGFLDVPVTSFVHASYAAALSELSVQHAGLLRTAQIPVRSPLQLICDHLGSLLRRRADAFVGVQEVRGLLDGIEVHAPALVREALGRVPLPLLTETLKRLVQEEVSIRNVRRLLEAVMAPNLDGDPNLLAERCRQSLHRYLSHKYAPEGRLYAYLVDPWIEQMLRAEDGITDPVQIARVLDGVQRVAGNQSAIFLCAPDVRRALRKLCEGTCPNVAVLTYAELDADLQIRPLGKVVPAAQLPEPSALPG